MCPSDWIKADTFHMKYDGWRVEVTRALLIVADRPGDMPRAQWEVAHDRWEANASRGLLDRSESEAPAARGEVGATPRNSRGPLSEVARAMRDVAHGAELVGGAAGKVGATGAKVARTS